MPRKPVVALVGRPNVGKSTLFNRLAGQRLAIVEDLPGTTRDRHYADVEWEGKVFTVVDTGGLVLSDADEIVSRVRDQAQAAMDEADVIVFLTDVTAGLTPGDEEIAALLRRTDKAVIVAANKADNLTREMATHEFHALGLGEPLAVSAIRGLSTGDLLDRIVAALPALPDEEDEPEVLHIAIVGRPNVGKSSLLNRLLRTDRAIVTPIPGTTRDTVEETVNLQGVPVVLVDTAGIAAGRDVVEQLGIERSQRAVARADLIVLVVDGSVIPSAEDYQVAKLVGRRPVVVVVNKDDLPRIDSYIQFLPQAPHVYVSALDGHGLDALEDCLVRVIFSGQATPSAEPLVSDPRHRDLLQRAHGAVVAALQTLSQEGGLELVAVDVSEAIHTLGEITGETAGDDLLETIFDTFCIGK